jgi:hypothetical protein
MLPPAWPVNAAAGEIAGRFRQADPDQAAVGSLFIGLDLLSDVPYRLLDPRALSGL